MNKGERAEQVENWYFRLNGFLSIPGFIVHPDIQRPYPRTKADLIAVRFPYSKEKIASRDMVDDHLITSLSSPSRTLFALVEVKSRTCNVNGPWSREKEKNMHRVIRRMGFNSEEEIDDVAMKMYDCLRWENEKYVLQYITIGMAKQSELQVKGDVSLFYALQSRIHLENVRIIEM